MDPAFTPPAHLPAPWSLSPATLAACCPHVTPTSPCLPQALCTAHLAPTLPPSPPSGSAQSSLLRETLTDPSLKITRVPSARPPAPFPGSIHSSAVSFCLWDGGSRRAELGCHCGGEAWLERNHVTLSPRATLRGGPQIQLPKFSTICGQQSRFGGPGQQGIGEVPQSRPTFSLAFSFLRNLATDRDGD